MEILDSLTPLYHPNPQTCGDSFSNFVEGFFDWGGKRALLIDRENQFVKLETGKNGVLTTALKIVLYATLIIPLAMLFVKAILRWGSQYQVIPENSPTSTSDTVQKIIGSDTVQKIIGSDKVQKIIGSDKVQKIIDQTSKFDSYRIGKGTVYEGTILRTVSLRPANLFFKALFGKHIETMPGSGKHFALELKHDHIQRMIKEAESTKVVSFSAKGIPGYIYDPKSKRNQDIKDLSLIYGDNTYQISYGELKSTLKSQKIYLAPSLPRTFYSLLKTAMAQDKLLGPDKLDYIVKKIDGKNCKELIEELQNTINNDPKNLINWGFASVKDAQELLDLHLYQLGALVVKSEDYRIFIDGNGKILQRSPGEKDELRLINACGIRNFCQTSADTNKKIMKETFETALVAAESGFVVFPAVGMGVWNGDPDLYWRAFLDAMISSPDCFEQIFINPGHQTTREGKYKGCIGEEFETILREYKTQYALDSIALGKLNKIVNLFDKKTDLVQLSYNLKKAYPDQIISLFNASDPDVTLGNHVGQYVNNFGTSPATEENYTAMGTNGLCFETITGVHYGVGTLIQVPIES